MGVGINLLVGTEQKSEQGKNKEGESDMEKEVLLENEKENSHKKKIISNEQLVSGEEIHQYAMGKNETFEELRAAGFEEVVGYIRVSTEGQAGEDKFGLEVQKKAISDYCTQNRMFVSHWYVDVVSGISENRKALNFLMFDYTPLRVKKVVAFKSDRIARETKLYFYILFMLEKKGLHLECVTEEFESEGEFANLYRSMLMFCAEQERKNIKMRTQRGKALKKEKGGYTGGSLPYGYGTAGGDLRVEKREAYIVQYIFYSYVELGMSYSSIAMKLNNRNIPTKRSGEWHCGTVKKIIQNQKFYQGYMKNKEGKWIKGKHQPLIREVTTDKKGIVPGMCKRTDFKEFDEETKQFPMFSISSVKQMREFGESQRIDHELYSRKIESGKVGEYREKLKEKEANKERIDIWTETEEQTE